MKRQGKLPADKNTKFIAFGGDGGTYDLLRHLTDGEFALCYINLADQAAEVHGEFVDMGLPVTSGVAFDMTDVFTGEHLGPVTDFFNPHIEGHDCKLYLCKLVKTDA